MKNTKDIGEQTELEISTAIVHSSPLPCYTSDFLSLFNMDNMKGMESIPDKYFELAIVDPNYGRKEHGGVNRSNMVLQSNGSKMYVDGNKYKKKAWDNSPADPSYFRELMRVSKHQIIWGCNYYTENFGDGRIVWDKVNDGADQSDCEIAYNSMTDRVDMVRFMWRGMMQGVSTDNGTIQQGNKALNEKRIHPTQKPVKVYEWILKKYALPGWKIVDTNLGSGSLAIACHNMGHHLTGYEIDQEYFKAMEQRIREHVKQEVMFR